MFRFPGSKCAAWFHLPRAFLLLLMSSLLRNKKKIEKKNFLFSALLVSPKEQLEFPKPEKQWATETMPNYSLLHESEVLISIALAPLSDSSPPTFSQVLLRASFLQRKSVANIPQQPHLCGREPASPL